MGNFCAITLIFTCLFVCHHVYGEDERWTACYTQFATQSGMCKTDFGAEYEPVTTQSCGTLSLGKKALCRRSYPGCKVTVCYSVLVSKEESCKNDFGSGLPIAKDTITDCAPGFQRVRCCPE